MAHTVDFLSKPGLYLHLDIEELLEKDSLYEGHISNLPKVVHMELKQNNFSILKGIRK